MRAPYRVPAEQVVVVAKKVPWFIRFECWMWGCQIDVEMKCEHTHREWLRFKAQDWDRMKALGMVVFVTAGSGAKDGHVFYWADGTVAEISQKYIPNPEHPEEFLTCTRCGRKTNVSIRHYVRACSVDIRSKLRKPDSDYVCMDWRGLKHWGSLN